jgi:hypothetical protein
MVTGIVGRKIVAAALGMAALLVTGTSTHAAVLVGDTFEYANQAAFEAVWPVVTAPGGTLTSSQAFSPVQSINYGTAAARNGRTFTATAPTATDSLQFSFEFYDSNPGLAPYRQFSNLQVGSAPSLTGDLISMGLNNNLTNTPPKYMARILGVNGSGYFKLDDAGAPDRSLGWHELKAIISTTNVQFYVDGILSKTQSGLTLSTKNYDTLRLGSGLSSTSEAFFDDVTVATVPVPEPVGLAFLALTTLPLLIRRRR